VHKLCVVVARKDSNHNVSKCLVIEKDTVQLIVTRRLVYIVNMCCVVQEYIVMYGHFDGNQPRGRSDWTILKEDVLILG